MNTTIYKPTSVDVNQGTVMNQDKKHLQISEKKF